MIGNRKTNRTEKPDKTKRHPAPYNPDPRWPGGYFQVLEELNIPKTRQPFYAHWVRLFFKRFLKRRRRDLGGRINRISESASERSRYRGLLAHVTPHILRHCSATSSGIRTGYTHRSGTFGFVNFHYILLSGGTSRHLKLL
jgi:integrase